MTGEESPRNRRRRPRRRLWFVLHAWLGLKLSILMAVIVLSGVLASLGHELEWLADPDLRVTPGREPSSYPDMARAVERARPDGVLLSIWGAEEPYLPAQAHVATADGALRKVYVDPFTAEVLADKDIMTIQTFLRNLHMQLFLPRHGILLVGFFGLILLFSTITGLVTYKKFWRGFFRLRLGTGKRVLWGDLHRLSGLWSLWFLILTSLTGMWYGFEVVINETGSELVYPSYPTISEARLDAADGPPPGSAPLPAAIATAKREVPGLTVTTVRLSTAPREPIVIHGDSGHALVRGRANAVFIDPFDASPVEVWRISEAGLAKRWVHMVDPLHFGTFGGLATKLIWTFFGLLICVQLITGSWMWLRRARKKNARAAVTGSWRDGDEPATAPRSRTRKGLGVWKYPQILVVILALLYAGQALVGY